MFTFTLVVALGVLAHVAYREDMCIGELVGQAVYILFTFSVLGLIRPWCWAAWRRNMPALSISNLSI